MGEYDERKLCVTLERAVTIPGKYHEPPQANVFRATERSVGDETTAFFGLNIGPPNTVVEVSNDNIRGVVHLGEYSDAFPHKVEDDEDTTNGGTTE